MAAITSISFREPVRNPAGKSSGPVGNRMKFFDVTKNAVAIDLTTGIVTITGTGGDATAPILCGMDNVVDWTA